MAKEQTKKATSSATELRDQSKQQNADFQSGIRDQQGGARTRRDDTFGSAYEGFKEQQKTGGFDESRLGGLRTQVDNISSTGGFDPTQLGNLRTRLADRNGGMDADAVAGLRSRGASLMDNGGYDQESTGKIREGYGKFIANGGMEDQDRENFLNRGTSGVTSTYEILKDRMAQDRARSGGIGAGGGYAQMARQLAQQQSASTLDSNVALNTMVNKNKMDGLGGLSGFEGDVAGGRRTAFNSVAGFEGNLAEGNRAQDKTAAGLEADVAGGIRSGTQMGIGLEGQVADNRNTANQGMMQMFQTASGEVSDLGKQMLQSMGLDYSTQESAIRSLTELSKNPGLFQTAIANIVDLAGAAAGIMGAQGGKPPVKPPVQP